MAAASSNMNYGNANYSGNGSAHHSRFNSHCYPGTPYTHLKPRPAPLAPDTTLQPVSRAAPPVPTPGPAPWLVGKRRATLTASGDSQMLPSAVAPGDSPYGSSAIGCNSCYELGGRPGGCMGDSSRRRSRPQTAVPACSGASEDGGRASCQAPYARALRSAAPGLRYAPEPESSAAGGGAEVSESGAGYVGEPGAGDARARRRQQRREHTDFTPTPSPAVAMEQRRRRRAAPAATSSDEAAQLAASREVLDARMARARAVLRDDSLQAQQVADDPPPAYADAASAVSWQRQQATFGSPTSCMRTGAGSRQSPLGQSGFPADGAALAPRPTVSYSPLPDESLGENEPARGGVHE